MTTGKKPEPIPFTPNWTIAPAATLREWLRENGISPPVLAVAALGRRRKGEALPLIEDVLARKPLLEAHAVVLAAGTGVPAVFWRNLEASYRAGLAAGLEDVTE